MSDMSAQGAAPKVATREVVAGPRSTETKASAKTSEFFVYVIAVLAVLIASLVVDGFNATEGWMFFTYLSIGYMISRGLAAGSSGFCGRTPWPWATWTSGLGRPWGWRSPRPPRSTR